MPSPFPGMNPYLEQKDVWEDFHHALLPAIRDYLSPQASPKYIVKLSEQLYVHELDPEEYRLVGKSDVSLSALTPALETTATTAMVAAPTQIKLLVTVDEVSQAS